MFRCMNVSLVPEEGKLERAGVRRGGQGNGSPISGARSQGTVHRRVCWRGGRESVF